MQNIHGHFAKFDQALSDLDTANPSAEAEPFVRAAQYAITNGQRFYVPDAARVLQGRLIDSNTKELIRLPFDCTVILSETFFTGVVPTDSEPPVPLDGKMSSWKITVAFNLEGDFNHSQKLMDPDTAPGPGFALLSLWRSPVHHVWVVIAGGCYFHLREHEDGYAIVPMDTPAAHVMNLSQEMQDDAATAMNLCAMLNMHNVSTAERTPPGKVNKKRLATGKRPLYSYRVLTVDGEQWDSLGDEDFSSGVHNEGVRSHLRRGHIRRLDGGSKLIWVRATFVRGSVPGFVDKDYNIRG